MANTGMEYENGRAEGREEKHITLYYQPSKISMLEIVCTTRNYPGPPYLQEHFLTTLPHGMTLFHIRTVRPPCPGQFFLTASAPPPFVARTYM
jgi:hypothetical protein